MVESSFTGWGKQSCLEWTPSHIGILGNQLVDQFAKKITQLTKNNHLQHSVHKNKNQEISRVL